MLNEATTISMFVSPKQKHNILKSQSEDLDLKIHDNELKVNEEQNALVYRSLS